MNAVVLAVRDGKSAVLLKDGTIRNIPKEYKVGETVHVASKEAGIISMVSAAAAALVIFVCGVAGYSYTSRTACSYVTLDVNPSIEYTLNRKDEVIKIAPLNTDAESIVASVNEQTGKKVSLDNAINQTLDVLTQNNYLQSAEENYLLFDVVSDSAERSDKLISTINEIADSNSTDDYHVISSSLEDHKQAACNNMSIGRYQVMKDELELSGAEVDESSVQAYKSKSVREMVTDSEQASEKSTTPDSSKDTVLTGNKTESAKPKTSTYTQPVNQTTASDSGSTVSAPSSGSDVSSNTGNVTASDNNTNRSSESSGKKKIATETSTEGSGDSSGSGTAVASADTSGGTDNGNTGSTPSGSGKKKKDPGKSEEPDPGSGSDSVPVVEPDPGTGDPGNTDPASEEPANPDPGNEDPANPDPGTEEPANPDPGTEDPGNNDPGSGENSGGNTGSDSEGSDGSGEGVSSGDCFESCQTDINSEETSVSGSSDGVVD